jgi:signal transduction histidine kinase
MKTEIAAVGIFAICAACIAPICYLVFEGLSYEFLTKHPKIMFCCAAIAAVLACVNFLWGYLSLVRRIKSKTLWKNSILCSVYKWAKVLFGNKASIWKISLEFVIFLSVQIILIGIGDDSFAVWIFIIILECVIFAYLAYEAIGKEKLENGIARIAGGEIDYKIPMTSLTEGQRKTAEMINSIGAGLEVALEESMRSERMKTDLITNVSHDIKTPLTSIVNYIDLLQKEGFTDSKIQRYLGILEEKAQRLKILTEDVVEASKISSGNISMV